MTFLSRPGSGSALRIGRLVHCASLAAATVSACYIPVVHAQSGILEEVVVTARRRAEMEQDVPISMKAMDTEYLRQQNIFEVGDLATKVPAVSVSNAGSSTNEPLLAVRGQRPTDVTLTLDQAAPLYFNEVVMTPTVGTNLSMYDLQSVQVLKGPQGTLFGRNSTGGAFLITPNRPGDQFGGYAEIKVGDYDLYGFEGAVDLPASDAVQFRVAGRLLKHDGYQDNVADNALKGKEKFWDEDSRSIRVTMNFDGGAVNNLATFAYDENEMVPRNNKLQLLNPDSQLGGFYDFVHNGGDKAYGFEGGSTGVTLIDDAIERLARTDANEIETDVLGSEDIENLFFSNITEYDLTNSLTMKNVFGYRDVNADRANDSDGSAVPLIGAITSATSHVTLDPTLTKLDAEQYSNELQLLGDAFEGSLQWITGVYWYRMKGTSNDLIQQLGANPDWIPIGVAQVDPRALGGITQLSPAGDVDNRAWAVFVEGNHTFSDKWSATLGLRYSYDEREFTARNFLGSGTEVGNAEGQLNCSMVTVDGTPLPVENCARTVSEDFDEPTWRISINYTPTDETMVYGTVSTGFRAGGFNMRGTDNDTLEPFKQETVLTYELGLKADWASLTDLPLRTNIAVYYQEYSDIQKTQSVLASDGTFNTTTVNAAEATIAGAELDVRWAVTRNLFVSLGYSYIDTRYDEWDVEKPWGPDGAPILVDASDGKFTYIPDQTATLAVSYMLPLDPALGEMSINASVYWQDEMDVHATPQLFEQQGEIDGWDPEIVAEMKRTAVEDGYDVWNLRFDWLNVMESNFDVAVYSTNITDEEYVLGGLVVPDILGISARTYGPPRTIGASLRYSF